MKRPVLVVLSILALIPSVVPKSNDDDIDDVQVGQLLFGHRFQEINSPLVNSLNDDSAAGDVLTNSERFIRQAEEADSNGGGGGAPAWFAKALQLLKQTHLKAMEMAKEVGQRVGKTLVEIGKKVSEYFEGS